MLTTTAHNKTFSRLHRFRLPIRSETDLSAFVEIAFGVRIPNTHVCPNHTTPFRAFADAYFARSPVSVWKSSRGFGGKSFLLALLGVTEAVTLGADVNILGGSGEQSKRVHEYSANFWNFRNAPKWLLASDPTMRQTKLAYGNKIQALTASQRSVRGPHVQRLRMDEIDEMDLPLLDAGLGQPMSARGIVAQTVLSSTHQHADGTMTEILKRAAEKRWSVYEWCWRETLEPHGWLASADVERKRDEVTAAMWQTEYDLQEPSPESRAILPEAVARMFQSALGNFSGGNGEYIEIEPPQSDGEYATGADWARKQDWTIIITLRTDVMPMRVVAFERLGRLSWDYMIARYDERLRRFNRHGAYDATGLGDVVGAYLQNQDAEGVVLTGQTRSGILSEYIAAIEQGNIISPMITWMEQEHRLASVESVFGGEHLPDTIAAGALAYHAARTHTMLIQAANPLINFRG